MADRQQQNNQKLLIALLALVGFMVGLAFAAVPLYDLFCRVTGFGGTTGVSAAFPEKILDRTVTVRFTTAVNGLPWDFESEIKTMDVKVGQAGYVSFKASNPTTHQYVGTAIYNVTPAKVGQYFHKVQCFCFGEQLLGPLQTVDMPVSFYVDPAIADDPTLDDVNTITLSYTFFKANSSSLETALDDYYTQTPE